MGAIKGLVYSVRTKICSFPKTETYLLPQVDKHMIFAFINVRYSAKTKYCHYASKNTFYKYVMNPVIKIQGKGMRKKSKNH